MSKDAFLDDVLRAKAGLAQAQERDLLLVNGKKVPFVGMGIDGRLINDYDWVKSKLGQSALRPLFTGPTGYFASVAIRTLPHFIFNPKPVPVTLWNGRDALAWRLNSRGERVGEPIERGGIIFKGDAMMLGASTVPYLGYQLRMYPFADVQPGCMQLKVATVSAPSVVANLPALWAGKWFPKGVEDFQAQSVKVEFAEAMPLQLAGDAAGFHQEVSIQVQRNAVTWVTF